MAYEKIVGLVLVFVLCVSSLEGSAIRKRSAGMFENELETEKRSNSEMTSRLILRLIDAAIADAEERGLDGEVVGELMRKRSGIRKCFFHAVNCW